MMVRIPRVRRTMELLLGESALLFAEGDLTPLTGVDTGEPRLPEGCGSCEGEGEVLVRVLPVDRM